MTIATVEKIDDSVIDINYAKKLLEALGEDISYIEDNWCYTELVEHYRNNKKLIDKIKQYFEQYYNGEVAYNLCKHKIVDRKWAEKIVERNNDPEIAYFMVKYCGSRRSWAENIIEKNNDSYYAYWMVVDCGSDNEWYERIKDSEYAHRMILDCLSDDV